MSRLSDDRGASLVELGLAMLVTAMISAALVTWISSAGAAASLHRADDAVVQELRLAKEEISRELRLADGLLAAYPSQLVLWVDGDGDEFVDAGERITWSFDETGGLTRSTDGGESRSLAAHLAVGSGFTYDAPTLAAITRITVTLVGAVESGSGGEPGYREVAVQIHMRNSP